MNAKANNPGASSAQPGIIRVAIIEDHREFRGLPSPAAAAVICGLVVFFCTKDDPKEILGRWLLTEPQFDLICELDHGCDPIPVTREQIAAIQAADPRCTG